MDFEGLKDPKRKKEGVVCIADDCVVHLTGNNYEIVGEYCTECECGFSPDQVVPENLTDINIVRLKFGQSKITINP
jgi:hypothetical protein